jgi:hypothetical protein
LKQYTPPAQLKQTSHTQPGVTYAQIAKPNSYAATNIEQTHPLVREGVLHEEERKQLSNIEN